MNRSLIAARFLEHYSLPPEYDNETTKMGKIMTNNIIKTSILSAIIVVLASITAFAQRDNISTAKWTLTYAYGKQAVNSTAFFEINIGRSRFMGNSGCNQMFGAVVINGNRINFSNIGMTKRMCKMMPRSIPESTVTQALDEAVRYRQNRNLLKLYNRRGRIILEFKILGKQDPIDEDESAVRLEDKKWILESIGNRKTLVAIKDAFIVFDPSKGSAGGNSGCNVFGGSYTSANKMLAVTEIISTMRACIEDGRMMVEREFLDGLRRANRYEIKSGRLFLYQNQMLLLTLRGKNK
ncbi:MAG: META domain-containing protein [Pyrinomonadaceae bacterium]